MIPTPGMVITESVTFAPGVYSFYKGQGITVKGSHLTVDGNGAVLIGGKEKGTANPQTPLKEFDYGCGAAKNEALGYFGTGLFLDGVKDVTVKNLTVKNFELGAKLQGCSDCQLIGNDFSYNYHNPDHGWEEHEDLGGILLHNTCGCVLEGNRANEVWSGLVIRYGDENTVIGNDFSHTSNVGLRLWRACRNRFENNNFSWGLRKAPGEVHARDSCCVLIETGSNENAFYRNDMRYGGDGLFIRSLNHWISTGNYFEENDASFANNNAIEAWDKGNTYVRNKANFSSYGFWLGNSDNTVLIENEAAYNGTCFRNAPESFGNAGISVVNGTGTNFVLWGNHIHHNKGVGIAARNKPDNPVHNWSIRENAIYANSSDDRGFPGYGIYLSNASHIYIQGNSIYGNEAGNIFLDSNTEDIAVSEKKPSEDILLQVQGPKRVVLGETAAFFAANTPNENSVLRWEFSDGYKATGPQAQRGFDSPGFYAVSVYMSVLDVKYFADSAFYVCPFGCEIRTDWHARGAVLFYNRDGHLVFQSDTGRGIGLYQHGDFRGSTDASLFALIRYNNEILEYKDNPSPVFVLYDKGGRKAAYTPEKNLITALQNKNNPYRYGFIPLDFPLDGSGYYSLNEDEGFQFGRIVQWEIRIDNTRNTKIEVELAAFGLYNRERDLLKKEEFVLEPAWAREATGNIEVTGNREDRWNREAAGHTEATGNSEAAGYAEASGNSEAAGNTEASGNRGSSWNTADTTDTGCIGIDTGIIGSDTGDS